jgi:hypothetical protein
MPSYRAIYTTEDGHKVVVTTLKPQPKKRKFKVAGGLRTFTRVSHKKQLQEILIVAKSAKKSKKAVTDDELEELEGLEELDELEDEDEDVDVEDEDEPEDEDEDEDEDEEPAPKKGRGKKSEPAAKKPPRKSRAAADGMVGTQEVAELCGIDSRQLRMALRELRKKDDSFAPDSETGRYQWKSLNDKQVKKIKKAIDAGLHKEVRDAQLNKLKEQKAAEKEAKTNDATTKTKKKGKKNKKASSEDE